VFLRLLLNPPVRQMKSPAETFHASSVRALLMQIWLTMLRSFSDRLSLESELPLDRFVFQRALSQRYLERFRAVVVHGKSKEV
jgi:hypothetical protein